MSTQQQARALMMRHHQFVKIVNNQCYPAQPPKSVWKSKKIFGQRFRVNPNLASVKPMTGVVLH